MRSSILLAALLTCISAAPVEQLRFAAAPSEVSLPTIDSLGLPSSHATQLVEHVQSLPEIRKVRLEPSGVIVEVTEGEKAILTYLGRKFNDVTDDDEYLFVQKDEVLPTSLSHTAKDLASLFKSIDLSEMKAFLTEFSSFRTRYYRSETGRQSQAFLMKTLQTIAKSNSKLPITISEFSHPWGQNSIIVHIASSSSDALRPSKNASTVILGAHQDSTNLLPFLAAPGADDDGSGTTTLVTAFKGLVKASFVPSEHPVEFHFYSAEEGGMLGSGAVAQDYARRGVAVKAMLQQDMTAWVKKGTKPVVGIITDFTDNELTSFVRKLVGEYATIGTVDTMCKYACSDHASWSKIGVPSAFAIESTFEDSNHNIHSGNDRIDYSDEFSFEHMREFVRLSMSFAIELGGGKNLKMG